MTEMIGVFEQSGPIKTTLQDFCGSFVHGKMTTTCILVAKGQDTSNCILWNASSHDLVEAIIVKISIVPVEISNLHQKLALVLHTLIRQNFTRHQIVNNVSIQRHGSDGDEMLIW